jgi:microcystin-dependent protein
MDQYLGFILLFGGNFNPRGFALCAGQLLPLSQNTALFSLLGTFYGGNGTSNFALPDLRGRTPIGQGQGSGGVSFYSVGEQTGSETVSLLQSNLPMHNHLVNAVLLAGDQTTPSSFILAEGPKSGSGPTAKSSSFYNTSAPNTTLNIQSISVNSGGAGIPVSIMQPYLCVTAIIALTGIFPARN